MICSAVVVHGDVLDGDFAGVLNNVLEGAFDDVLDGVLAILPST